ncbi:hypothetical protein A3740_00240 [Oleiphilus sp. HI0068]|nr:MULTISPECIES: hypothetical protein [unclassified Oleiphilus]KZY75528.1 hypothetical protein A3740_00240 [Oleiphilus sp. HI0068]KZY77329.1 hypothetical protein A3741_09805 [Oleiphilus sp. HI0069]KZY97479.1 hypothetical protein A3743_00010 [Oleiphilus sp. HI0072]KZY33661.1 hypothetical protein A3729_06140 [Oleiphilus sp. HI0043]KZY58251.1 hypothetical protein A3735_03495 [Oleiphilus sp. HI0061]
MGIKNEHSYLSASKGFKIAALSAAVAIASGCSSPDHPDNGSPVERTSISGVAIDGYLAGATVYADINEDGRQNAGEPSATTDSEGFFTTSSDGTTNYCESAATEKYCLQLKGDVPDEVVLRTYGGFDIFTGEPFIGELSARVSPEVDGKIPDQMITPLSSVMVEGGSATLGNLISDPSLLDDDFLSGSDFNSEAANKAYLLHKIAVIFADVFEEKYDVFGEESFFPDSSSTFIYEQFADQLAGSSAIDSTMIASVFDAVNQQIIDTYNDNEDDDSISNQISGAERTAALTDVADILGLVNAAIPSSPSDPDAVDADSIRARMIGVEMVVTQMINDEDSALIDDAIDEALDVGGPLYDAIGDGTDVDFSTLVGVDFSAGTIDYDGVSVTGGVTFGDLAGKELFVEYSDDEDNVEGAALILFEEDENLTGTGELKLCIRYSEDGAFDGQFSDEGNDGSLETDGALFDAGEWTAIDDRRLILNVLGGFDFTLISRGQDSSRNIFSLSYTGESRTWDTDQSLEDIAVDGDSAQMNSHEDCQARLNNLSNDLS